MTSGILTHCYQTDWINTALSVWHLWRAFSQECISLIMTLPPCLWSCCIYIQTVYVHSGSSQRSHLIELTNIYAVKMCVHGGWGANPSTCQGYWLRCKSRTTLSYYRWVRTGSYGSASFAARALFFSNMNQFFIHSVCVWVRPLSLILLTRFKFSWSFPVYCN